MSSFAHTVGSRTYQFRDLKDLMAKATPARSGDFLAELAAASAEERVAAQMALADLPLTLFLNQMLVPYEADEVTRLIIDEHDRAAFAPIAHLTVGDFRNWLLSDAADEAMLAAVAPGITPEMAAAVCKIMRIQDLVLVARKCRVVTRFRNTLGLAGRMATRLQPNHPTDDATGIAASLLDGLLYGSGDAVIGINPATDNVPQVIRIVGMLDEIIARYDIPTQSCVLTHVTNTIAAIERGAPVDLVFQSIAGTEAANASFGVNLALLGEAREAALSLRRATAYARASQVCWSTPWWALADSALPCPVSKYMTLSPTVPRPSDSAASRASSSKARLRPKLALAASVPAIDWNTRSTGAPRSMAAMVLVTWVSTHDWVGMP